MQTMLVWLGIGILIGYFWGRYTTIKAVTIIFKQFRDEMHAQYLKLLKDHGIYDDIEKQDTVVHYSNKTFKN